VQKPLQHWAGLVQAVWPPQHVPPRQVPPYWQPPVVALHAPPSGMRHRESVSQVSPVQQSCADVVQVPPLVFWQQRPPLQVRPSQQRSPAAQACARSVQQVAVAVSQRALPQHPELLLEVEQACRFGMQAPHVDTLHARGLQQLAVDEQLVPSAPQHVPPTQAPAQQSAPSAQVTPLLPQGDR
jgi:hypothetical protein